MNEISNSDPKYVNISPMFQGILVGALLFILTSFLDKQGFMPDFLFNTLMSFSAGLFAFWIVGSILRYFGYIKVIGLDSIPNECLYKQYEPWVKFMIRTNEKEDELLIGTYLHHYDINSDIMVLEINGEPQIVFANTILYDEKIFNDLKNKSYKEQCEYFNVN